MYQKNKQLLYKTILIVLLIQVFTGCKKFVEISTPPDKISQENVFSTDRSATTVVTGIYTSMQRSGTEMALYGGLLADEWSSWSGSSFDNVAYHTNTLESRQNINSGMEIWNLYYNLIFKCNAALEGLVDNNKLTPTVRQQLLGEVYFLRSWFYFYLTNLYGDLPLAIGTDPEINRLLLRSSSKAVNKLIVDDLLKAQDLLSSDFVNGQLKAYGGLVERVRPTKWAATALLARQYLYLGDDAKAEVESSKVIGNATLFSLDPLNEIFLKNSREAIWQVQPIDIGWNTFEARTFHLGASPFGFSSDKPVYFSTFILNAFELNDQRLIQWVDSFDDGTGTYSFPIKYKVAEEDIGVASPESLTEYSMMLRLGEQYLIRAEAKAKQNNLNGAIADLDMIRNRAKLTLIANTNPGISQTELLDAILHERQVELFAEWGHRWFDLKRTGKVDAVMSVVTPQKGGNWESTDQLLPIPYNEILFGVNLRQNPGY